MDKSKSSGTENFWEQKPKRGRKPLYSSSEDLERDCMEYFEVTSKRTWDEQDWKGKDAEEVIKHHPTPFTLTGLHLFLGMSDDTWANYRKKEEFLGVCTRVEKIIRTQKFEGASTGFFNHAIIARDLGLVDKKELSGDPDKPLEVKIGDTTFNV